MIGLRNSTQKKAAAEAARTAHLEWEQKTLSELQEQLAAAKEIKDPGERYYATLAVYSKEISLYQRYHSDIFHLKFYKEKNDDKVIGAGVGAVALAGLCLLGAPLLPFVPLAVGVAAIYGIKSRLKAHKIKELETVDTPEFKKALMDIFTKSGRILDSCIYESSLEDMAASSRFEALMSDNTGLRRRFERVAQERKEKESLNSLVADAIGHPVSPKVATAKKAAL